MTTVLLTGAAGKVGKHVMGALGRRGLKGVATDIASDGIPEGVRFERCDLTDADAVQRMVARGDDSRNFGIRIGSSICWSAGRGKSMTVWKTLAIAALTFALVCVPGKNTVPRAAADGPIVIRYASLAPGSSAFGKVQTAWSRTVKKETQGRVEIRTYSGGSQGDERDFLRKIRVGQIDAAGITAIGLGMVVRPILALTAPGVITRYDQLNHVRNALRPRFEKLFEEAGFELVAWGDGGLNRLFSTKPFARPADLKRARPWAWKDDPVYLGFISAIGANPVKVGAMEVYGGLQTRMIDFVPASAMAAVAFQWHTKLNYVSKQNLNIVIGGSIIEKEKMGELTPGDQKILRDTAARAVAAMDRIVLRDDAKAYDAMLKRGMKEVDLSPYQAEWDAVAKKAREQLVGRVYSKELLALVEKLAAEAK